LVVWSVLSGQRVPHLEGTSTLCQRRSCRKIAFLLKKDDRDRNALEQATERFRLKLSGLHEKPKKQSRTRGWRSQLARPVL
jgi:hypothetical protein